MKVKLFICGQPRGIIEVGENSIVGQLLQCNWPAAQEHLVEMIEEINQVSNVEASGNIDIPITGKQA